jgi:hypothetical protein
MFKHSVEALADFFGQLGRGFYIPFYQRLYSWDEENAKKLLDDVLTGVKKIPRKSDHVVFMGSIILHDERSPRIDFHWDTPNLLTKVYNVVDGQQRISTFGILACVLVQELKRHRKELETIAEQYEEIASLQQGLNDEAVTLGDFFAVETRKGGAAPVKKPKIIRALSTTTNPVADQWTLNGAINSFYKSDVASIFSEFIANEKLPTAVSSERIAEVIEAFQSLLSAELKATTVNDCDALMKHNGAGKALEGFIDIPPNLIALQQNLRGRDLQIVCQAILILAACYFLRKKCHLVVIECANEDLAFDMFQSLNATGTPLTAFEVFKPAIVNGWGGAYSGSIKSEVDRIEAVFEKETSANKKEEITDKVVCSTALVFNGKTIGARFSEERNWLIQTFKSCASLGVTAQASLIQCLADTAEYYEHVIKPRAPNKNSTNFSLVNHLASLGLSTTEADLAALCLFYLRDAKHRMSHSIIGVFYSLLIRAQSHPPARLAAASEFLSVCKATAAFFTLWMGGGVRNFPDSDYRRMFEDAAANVSWFTGQTNQNVSFVKRKYQEALAREGVYDHSSAVQAKQLWVSRASNVAWYQRRAVCRFGLFAAFQDASVDLTIGREGLTVNGMPGCATYLSCNKWYSTDQEVIEHIAVRDKPSTIKYPLHFDASIYPGNNSVVDKIGNLTLLSLQINSSIYSEWPDKTYYYWSLTTPVPQSQGPQGGLLASSLGIEAFPPSLGTLAAASNYISHLAPIAYRGTKGLQWDKAFIEKRSNHLCEKIYDQLIPWLV